MATQGAIIMQPASPNQPGPSRVSRSKPLTRPNAWLAATLPSTASTTAGGSGSNGFNSNPGRSTSETSAMNTLRREKENTLPIPLSHRPRSIPSPPSSTIKSTALSSTTRSQLRPSTHAHGTFPSVAAFASPSANPFAAPTTSKFPRSSLPTRLPSTSATTSTSTSGLAPSSSFRSPFPSSKGKHKLSPSPSPHQRTTSGSTADEDFVMISPLRPTPYLSAGPSGPSTHGHGHGNEVHMMRQDSQTSASSPIEDSPTPACGVTSAAARLRLVDDDSPIGRPSGQSRSLATAHELEKSRGRAKQAPASPLKFLTSGSGSVESMGLAMEPGEGSPTMPDTPLLPNGLKSPPTVPLFPARRPSAEIIEPVQPKTLFNASSSKSIQPESRIPRLLSTSHPLRARSGTNVGQTEWPMLSQKKAVSLDAIPIAAEKDDAFGSVSTLTASRKVRAASNIGNSVPSSSSGRAHKRINSGEYRMGGAPASSISRSRGHASGLALSLSSGLGPLPVPGLCDSNSSLSSLSTAHLTPPISAFSPAEPPIFEDVKPLAEAFEASSSTVARKFKPRDSTSSVTSETDKPASLTLVVPPTNLNPRPAAAQPKRPAMLKRTSSMGDERASQMEVETPLMGPSANSGWPGATETNRNTGFELFGASGWNMGAHKGEERKEMPGTPVKKSAYGHGRSLSLAHAASGAKFGHSHSQPSLGSFGASRDDSAAGTSELKRSVPPLPALRMPPPSTKKAVAAAAFGVPAYNTQHLGSARTPTDTVQLTLTTTDSSPHSEGMDTDLSSPTIRISGTALPHALGQTGTEQGLLAVQGRRRSQPVRMGLLRRLSEGVSSTEGSEDEGTPTKGGGERMSLTGVAASPSEQPTPTHSPRTSLHPKDPTLAAVANASSAFMPRMSLPAFSNPKVHRPLHHRQSQPAPTLTEEEDLFEKRFVTLDTLGKGAFSTVVKAEDRANNEVYAVKKARGVFDGVKDRLRHLEEVDILRHLSRDPPGPNPHVIRFVDAWEQNRQLFIQTELCLGSLAFFLEEYGSIVERLDEGRVWKVVRELSDGLAHIHSSGVIHFDVKPANILISGSGELKIGDFGLATRWPRLTPEEILEGSGLGGTVPDVTSSPGAGVKLEREGDRVYMPPEMLKGVFVMAADVFSFGLVILEVSTNICVPDGGPPWHALRSDDFSVVDLSPLSPALVELITSCMQADPAQRPEMAHVVEHPIVQRARQGKPALVPEDEDGRWLVGLLTGDKVVPAMAAGVVAVEATTGDVEMA